MARAVSVPMTTEIRVDTPAMIRLFRAASIRRSLPSIFSYHDRVKPCQTEPVRALLNEKITSTMIGTYKKAKVSSAMESSPKRPSFPAVS
jgi:hypothetical protein